MRINKNSNINKALGIFKVGKTTNNKQEKNNFKSNNNKLNYLMDDLIESQYITRNFQIGVTYVQIAKSTLNKVKEIILEMKETFDKCKNEENTSFGRESLNIRFEDLCKKFNKESSKLTVDLRENLFYNSKNELVFKVFDSSSLENCILIPKLDTNKLTFRNANIKNMINAEDAQNQMNKIFEYILSSEKTIKSSEEKLSKVNLTDIMSENLVALSSNENKESIENFLKLTKRGLMKESNSYMNDINSKNVNDLLD